MNNMNFKGLLQDTELRNYLCEKKYDEDDRTYMSDTFDYIKSINWHFDINRMKLTQEIIDQIQEAMLHTNLKGEINWKDGDEIEIQVAGTFAKDKFIVIKNISKNPFENAQPHPHFDYEES